MGETPRKKLEESVERFLKVVEREKKESKQLKRK
jgi:hypothetical protein